MNIEKYNKLHDTIMQRLSNGEITVEKAKDVADLAFSKYINENNIMYDDIDNFFNILTEKSDIPLINTENILKSDTYITETFYGSNKYLEEIESCFNSLKTKVSTDPKGSEEIKIIENNLALLFGFENVYLTILPAQSMNACTIPIFYEYKNPTRKNFTVEKTAEGIRYKNPKNKSLYVYMTSYTIEKFTPRECVAVLLHEVGHNFYAVEDHYKYIRTRVIISMLIQALVLILTRNPSGIGLGLGMLIDLFLFCLSPQKYEDSKLQAQTRFYKYKAKEPGFIQKSLLAIFKFITGIVGVALSPIMLLIMLPTVYLTKACNKYLSSNADSHDYLQEKFSDDFAASYGYAVEVANIFKTGRNLSFNSEFISKIPILNLMNTYNNAVYNSTAFLCDPHPERHYRCVNVLKKLKYELDNNSDNLTDSQKQQIVSDISTIEKIVEKSAENKDPLSKLIQDKLGLVVDKDAQSHGKITDEVLFDFEGKIFGKKR